jgi:hypothetical protein
MTPVMGLTLAHPTQPPRHDLPRGGFQVDQETHQPILRRWEWTVLIGRLATGGAWLPLEPPAGHMGLEGGFEGWHSRLQLVHRETGQVQDLRGAGLDVGES